MFRKSSVPVALTIGSFDTWLPVVSDGAAAEYNWAPPICWCNIGSSQTHCSRGSARLFKKFIFLCVNLNPYSVSCSQKREMFILPCTGWYHVSSCVSLEPTETQSALVGFSMDATVFLQPNQISRDVACRWMAEAKAPDCHGYDITGERELPGRLLECCIIMLDRLQRVKYVLLETQSLASRVISFSGNQ